MESIEAEVRALLDKQAEAMREKDLDRLMSMYAYDIVYFDVVPPLQYAGSAALRDRFSEWFDGYRGPIGLDVRDLNVFASGDIAFAHWFNRASGTLVDGREVGTCVRVTNCWRRSERGWLITHEHVSIPVDLSTGRPAMGLEP